MKVEKVREKDGKLELLAELDSDEVAKEMERAAAQEISKNNYATDKKIDNAVAFLRKRLGADEASFVIDEGIMRQRTPFALTAVQVDAIGKPVYKCTEHAQEGRPFEFHMVCVPVPVVTLDSYGPVSFTMPPFQANESEIDEEIKKLAEASSTTVTDTSHDTVQKGDKVEIAMETTMDGEKVKNLCAEKREYATGTFAMPDDFDDAIIGMHVDETKTFTFQGPRMELDRDGHLIMDNYECTVTLRRILSSARPEMTDAWAQTVMTGAKDMADLRKKVGEKLHQKHKDEHSRQAQNLAAGELAKRIHEDIPDLVYAVALKEARDNLTSKLREDNISLDDYLKKQGVEKDQLNNSMLMQVRNQLLRQLALNAFAKYKQLKCDDEDLYNFFDSIAPGQANQVMGEFRREGRMYAARCAALRLKANKILVEEAEAKELEV